MGSSFGKPRNSYVEEKSERSLRDKRRTNPLNADGSISVCAICGSRMHWAKKCPHVYEIYYLEQDPIDPHDEVCDEVQITLMAADTHDSGSKLDTLLGEAICHVLLDSGCSKTVCGEKWFECLIDTLSDSERSTIIYEHSNSVYRFGDGQRVNALRRAVIPCILAGNAVKVKTDIVSSNIPLLLSKSSMKRAGMVIDLNTDTVIVFNKRMWRFLARRHNCMQDDQEL